jgi:hypothetical protein
MNQELSAAQGCGCTGENPFELTLNAAPCEDTATPKMANCDQTLVCAACGGMEFAASRCVACGSGSTDWVGAKIHPLVATFKALAMFSSYSCYSDLELSYLFETVTCSIRGCDFACSKDLAHMMAVAHYLELGRMQSTESMARLGAANLGTNLPRPQDPRGVDDIFTDVGWTMTIWGQQLRTLIYRSANLTMFAL